jgi:hypothetical protein
MLFFMDQSGRDHGEAPYEVQAAVAIAESDLWNLVRAIRAAEIEFFGIHLAEVGVEFSGRKLLKKKTFRHARQGPEIESNRRRELAREFLNKGWLEARGGPPEARSRDEFTAFGQATCWFVLHVLELCASHRVKIFAALVDRKALRPVDLNLLRRDYAFLFQRFIFYLEDRSQTEMGLVVFDNLQKAESRLHIKQMEMYFLKTEKGSQRSARIVPQPCFVQSDLTTAVQLADIIAYCFNWGTRLNKMKEPTRSELEPLAQVAFDMRYAGKRFDESNGQERPVYGVFYVDDLKQERALDSDR